MNIDKIYYARLIEIVDKYVAIGQYEYKSRFLGNRLVYKSGDNYIDLKTKSKYNLFSKSWNLETGMIVIDDEMSYGLVNLRNIIDLYNVENDAQIFMHKYISKRKILKMIERGKK